MNYEQRTNKGFTLIELLVAIGILAVVLSFAGVIFKVSIDAHRTAIANAQIMQKLRAITDQLNSDFKGLRKDGEIFVAWLARPVPGAYKDSDLDGYERFDRIVFFADGDFDSYGNPTVRGNVARICYMVARRGNLRPEQQNRTGRVLARTQHVLTADPALAGFPDPNTFVDQQWYQWNNLYEYDKISLEAWKTIPWANKADMLSVITDIQVQPSNVNPAFRGAVVDPADPNSIHMLLCEGVGEFKIQGWSDAQRRWVPEVDPDGDGDLTDSHFYIADANSVPGVLYPYPPYGGVAINNINYPRQQINEANFDAIPGLGRALKFTFTLYDSKGVIKEGRTFTHIVYLD
jgi:prepilin-type N-terminal cleavage/methylation domain-containing protein